MSLIPIQLRSDNLDAADIIAKSGEFNNKLTVGGIPVLLSGQDPTTGNITASVSLPTGISESYYLYTGFQQTGASYLSPPQVLVTMRMPESSDFIYGCSTYAVSRSGFGVAFTDNITETGYFLDIIVDSD